MSHPVSIREARRSAGGGSLTRREWEVAKLLAQGLPAKAIAACLGVSVHTVRRHSEAIFRKLRVRSRTVAALRIRELMTGATEIWAYRPVSDSTAWGDGRGKQETLS